MTYCVGLKLDKGLILMSDTRTNAGVDDISQVKKMHSCELPGERIITLLSAGNLATTQAVISLLDERTKAPEDREALYPDGLPGDGGSAGLSESKRIQNLYRLRWRH